MSRLGLFTKDQLAARYSLALKTIEHYVDMGLLTPITLHDGVFFTSKAFIIIEIIEKGHNLGFTLDEIRQLTRPYTKED